LGIGEKVITDAIAARWQKSNNRIQGHIKGKIVWLSSG